jgi:hypothetical protein
LESEDSRPFLESTLVNKYELKISPIYAMSKTAVNMVAAKFNAEYKKSEVA